jgi:hypothetical protein
MPHIYPPNQVHNEWRTGETHFLSTASAICGVKTKHTRQCTKPVKNLWCHFELFEPATSL